MERCDTFLKTPFLAFILGLLSLNTLSQERVEDNLIVLYSFNQESGEYITDISGNGTPLLLKIQDVDHVTWLPGGGLSIDESTRINSLATANKISEAVQESNAISLELWVKPNNTTQDGPARIMTLSHGSGDRNFMIGQDEMQYKFRMRTTNSNVNGMPNTSTPNGIAENDLQHIVYTWDGSGDEHIYINGSLVETDTRNGDCANWSHDFALALANEIDSERPWFGELYLASVYSDVLTEAEVEQNYNAGHLIASNPVSDGVCADEECFVNGYGLDARMLWLPGLPNNAHHRFKFDEYGGHFEVFENGTAHLFGNTIDMTDPSQGFYIDVYLSDRMNWEEWSALGRGWKGNASIVGDLYTTWDYYIMDPDQESVLIGTGGYEGSLLTLTHRPADYYFGFQVGIAANDQNAEPGMSCWFDYSGYVNGEYADHNGDINMEGECVNLPVMECALDVELDCEAGLDPETTGMPILNCPDEYVLTYSDEYLSDECPMITTRTWTATGPEGDIVECIQTIAVSDEIAPWIFVTAATTDDCTQGADPEVVVSDLCDPNVSYEITPIDTLWASGEPCITGQLRTQTMGGWGANPNGNNPGVYLNNHFEEAFPDGLSVGCGENTLTLTSAQAVTAFLPSGSLASILPMGGMTDPGDAYNNVLAGQLVAITLSLGFDAYDASFGASELSLSELLIQEGDFVGMTVGEFVAQANAALGGCVDVDLSAVNDVLSSINQNYVDGTTDNGFLACDLPWDCYLEFVYEVSATDACGNEIVQEVSTYFVDQTTPQLPEFEEFITVNCDGIPDPEIILEGDCASASTTLEVTDVEFSGGCFPTIQRTYYLADQCGNDTTATQYITVVDQTPPVFTNTPENLTLACGAEIPEFDAEATDNCDGAVVVTLTETTEDLECGEMVVKTWTAADGCGNTASVSQYIVFSDWEAPYPINELQNGAVSCGEVIPATDVQFIDDCTEVTVTFTEEESGDACYLVITRVWTAIDACGNEAIYTQNIQVVDDEAPTFSNVPADLTISCEQSFPNDQPEASDNCSELFIEELLVLSSTNEGCEQWERTWIATDECGNQATVVQMITMADEEAPVFVNPPVDYTGACSELLDAPEVTVEDNCDSEIEVTITENIDFGNCEVIVTRTWVAMDACGNTASHVQTVTLTDSQEPQIIGSNEITIGCNSIDNIDLVEVIDDCQIAVGVWYSDLAAGAGCNYDIYRTWTAVDACGNTAEFQQVLHVVDEEAPVFESTPEDLVIGCDDDIPQAPEMTASDCGAVDIEMIEEWLSEGCSVQMIRTWVATDLCGNQSSIVQTIEVVDDQGPVFDLTPANLTISCGDDLPVVPNVSVTDGCDGSPEISFEEYTETGNCAGSYTVIRLWTATDQCGNTSSITQEIEVTDTIPPSFDQEVEDLTVDCGDIPEPPVITASDNCGGDVTVDLEVSTGAGGCPNMHYTWTATDDCGNSAQLVQTLFVDDTEPPVLEGIPANTSTDCSNVPEMPDPEVSDNCDDNVNVTVSENIIGGGCQFTIVRTWIASDDCGNTTVVSQSIVVEDTAPPVFVEDPADITVDCQELENVPLPEVVDDCGAAVFIEFYDEVLGSGCEYDVFRTYQATDMCGHSTTATQTIHVIDMSPPVISGIGPNIYTDCNNIPDPETPVVTDACNEIVDVTLSENTFGSGCDYYLSRTWTALDACGNSASLTQMVFVSDETAPEISGVPADLTLSCNDEIPAPASPSASDNCTADVGVSFIQFSEEDDCGVTVTRIWTSTDDCGNTASATQIIALVDDESPVLFGIPTTTQVTCDNIPEPVDVIALDECSDVTVWMNEEVIPGDCPFTLRRTWYAQDVCGNISSAAQDILVVDYEAPVLSDTPADVVVGCGDIPDVPDITATDDCVGNVLVQLSETWDQGDCLSVLFRTWTATDYCGNATSHTQIIEIVDDASPEFGMDLEDQTIACEEVQPMESLLATDACGPVIVEMSETSDQEECASQYAIERVWTATDLCGNVTVIDQVIQVIDTMAPELSELPEDVTVLCDEIPEVPGITATDNCDNDVEIFYTEHSTAEYGPIETCNLSNASNLVGDIALWLPSLSGFGSDYVFGEEGGTLVRNLEDGTAVLTGEVCDVENPDFRWIIELHLYDAQNWEEWSANGGSYKDDQNLAEDRYLDWTYYKLADISTLTGAGLLEGSFLNLSHAPSDYTFGFQLGEAATNRNAEYGMSGWFYYTGQVYGYDVSGVGDVITENSCCPEHELIRTWMAVDCAGNMASWTQTITVINEVTIAPIFYTSGEAVLDVYNSTGDQFFMSIDAPVSGQAVIKVKDGSGSQVRPAEYMTVEAGERYSHQIPKEGLASGIYHVQVTLGGKVYADAEFVE